MALSFVTLFLHQPLPSRAEKSNVLYLVIPVIFSHSSSTEWWKPHPGTRWQWQLEGSIDTSYDVNMYDIDLFETPHDVIEQLHDRQRVVICYMSAGSWETWRPDADFFPSAVLGNTLEGLPGEKCLDTGQLSILGPIAGSEYGFDCCEGLRWY